MLRSEALEVLSKSIVKFSFPDMLCFGINGWDGPSKDLCNKLLNNDFVFSNILPKHINIHPQNEMFLQPYTVNKCYSLYFLRDSNIRFNEEIRTWEDNPFIVSCISRIKRGLVLIDNDLYSTGDSGNDDHLSAKYNLGLLESYIDSYERYVNEFGDKFNFHNGYTTRRYFTYLISILHSIYLQEPDAFTDVLSKIIINKTVVLWAKLAKPKTFKEIQIKHAILHKHIDCLRFLLKNDTTIKNRLFDLYFQIKIKIYRYFKD